MLESYIHNTSTNPNTNRKIWFPKFGWPKLCWQGQNQYLLTYDHRGHHFDAMAMSAAMWGNRSWRFEVQENKSEQIMSAKQEEGAVPVNEVGFGLISLNFCYTEMVRSEFGTNNRKAWVLYQQFHLSHNAPTITAKCVIDMSVHCDHFTFSLHIKKLK